MKIYQFIFTVTLVTISSQAQTTGPTVTSAVSIVPGSTSGISIAKASSINLTSNFISGVTATPTPTQIIFVTGDSSSSSSSSSSTALLATVTDMPPTPMASKLSSTDLGAIIGGCAGGLLLLSIITALCCVRHRRKRQAKKALDLSRGISSSMIFSKDAYTQQNPHYQQFDLAHTANATVKKYNVDNDKTLQEEEQVMTPPVILYNKVNNSTSPQPRGMQRQASQMSKHARLSKYNFLSQAFSQMRTSYAGQTTEEPKDRSYHDSMILSPVELSGDRPPPPPPANHAKYQMYSMYVDSSTDGAFTASSPFKEEERESTVTLGTLHAPLFQQQKVPPPLNKSLYTSGVITPNMHRDSIISDVSQYNNTPSPLASKNKPYPYF